MAKPPIINLDSLPVPEHNVHGSRYESFDVGISSLIGARKLGYAHTVVPPGKRSCPFHNHWEEEELFIILEGRGTYRLGEERFPVRAGDVIAAPTGGRETAHHLINDSDADLKYLSISTHSPTEIVEYPDSGKVGMRSVVSAADGSSATRFRFRALDENGKVDYWDGED
ncbi:cupin domain-containing protein [Chitinimonas sp. PSY-7]|uniref:cupin domain-containing protein n=1 Tax=Chitinimonas sp. PSY-7 TaxID=3459088 RepID=UPI0040400EE7